MKSSHASTKLERKEVEKNRRMHMKSLCFKLASLIPIQHQSREPPPQQDKLDQAADYIKKLKERIEELKRKRDLVMNFHGINRETSGGMMMGSSRLPMVEVSESGSTLKVVLITGLNRDFMFSDVIRVIEEEGAEVVSVSQYVVADRVFHILHSQVRSSRVCYESARVLQRLNELVH